MGISAWAYDTDQYWLSDLIDFFRGKNHCEKKWEEKFKVSETDKKIKKFWRGQ